MKITRIIAAFAAVALVCSCGQKKQAPAFEPLRVELDSLETVYAPAIEMGSAAPEFTVNTPEGAEISLKDFAGKYLVIDFWATWCGDCRREFPEMKKLIAEYNGAAARGTTIEFFSLSFDHDGDKWREMIIAEGFDWKQGSNLIKWKENPISEAYGIKWIPTMMIITPDGKVLDFAINAERLRVKLEALSK